MGGGRGEEEDTRSDEKGVGKCQFYENQKIIYNGANVKN